MGPIGPGKTTDMTRDTTRARTGSPKSRPDEFRRAIEKAEADGAARSEMVLHLTLSDTADLKRDRGIPVEDISFRDGVMSFMGVKVSTGGVAASALQTSDQDASAADAPAA